MLKSMYSGISGMKANQTKMDVVGNNVANASTTAFKKSSVRFSDTLNQTIIHSSQANNNLGGVNPGQVGIGVKVSSIAKNMLQGSLQQTAIPSDLAIDGDGFFVVQLDKNGESIIEGYTRDGSLTLDKNGNLVTSNGYYVLTTDDKPVKIPNKVWVNKDGDLVEHKEENIDGNTNTDGNTNIDGNTNMDENTRIDSDTNTDGNTNIDGNTNTNGNTNIDGNKNDDKDIEKRVISYSISKEGEISYILEDGTRVDGLQTLKIATFVNTNGLEANSSNIYVESSNSGKPEYNSDGAKHGLIIQGALEMSNVDLSEEFTDMIVTTRAFQASSKVITTSDELLQEIINLKR